MHPTVEILAGSRGAGEQTIVTQQVRQGDAAETAAQTPEQIAARPHGAKTVDGHCTAPGGEDVSIFPQVGGCCRALSGMKAALGQELRHASHRQRVNVFLLQCFDGAVQGRLDANYRNASSNTLALSGITSKQ